MKRICILLIFVSISLRADFTPENNSTINYTQILFSWPQIINTINYQLNIADNEVFDNQITLISESNSYISTGDLDWGNNYFWKVCNHDGLICHELKEFSISELPQDFPDNISIIDYNENSFHNGINILDFESLHFSAALTMEGDPIWFADKYQFNGDKIVVTEFLSNGNFIGMSNGPGYEFTKNSEVIFTTPSNYAVHHQITRTENETYFFIDAEVQFNPCPEECDGLIQWQGDQFIEVDKLGNVIWEWNMFDYINLTEYNPYWIEVFTGTLPFDWSHSNSVHFDGDLVYISIRNLSRITAIDYESKEIVWNLGNPDFMDTPTFSEDFGFSHQHSAQKIENGNILFFDNGRDNNPQVSRCIEIDVDLNSEPELVWEYILPDTLVTLSRGECDRLETGGTIISVGRTGHIIELNSSDEIVWKMHASNNNFDVSIYRNQRVPNLYPEAFSFEIDYLDGEYNEYLLPYYERLDFTIHNYGWGNQNLYYEFIEDGNVLLEGMLDLNQSTIDFDVDSIDGRLYTFNIFSDSTNIKSVEFILSNPLLGDINADSIIDILDIMLCVNFIMEFIISDNYQSYISDINGDNLIDILDILNLVNIVISNNE